jgi:hypothetical protein
VTVRHLLRKAQRRLYAAMGWSWPKGTSPPRLEPTVCAGCENKDYSVEVRCVTPGCPDPRWTPTVTEPNSEGVVGAAIALWNTLNARPVWTVSEFKRGLAASASKSLTCDRDAASQRLAQDERPKIGGGSRGYFGEGDN